ncbi:MAG: BLUF domain-containing protein [Eudoraea sp.]|nr:BLUF domain-containing protein [Eudoraea sp.]
MFSLVYKSVGKPGFGIEQIQEMLKKAKAYNHSNGITGCLLYHEGEFIQYLEGNQIRVLNLFDKIKQDPRHHKVELLSYEEREKREFEQWDMAFENLYGENEHITHLKLMVSEFYDSKDPNKGRASKDVFWETVRNTLMAKQAN